MSYYGKTMLSCYKTLDKVITQIENLIKGRVKNSFFNYSSAYCQAEKLIQLNEIRLDLMELKEITKEALSVLSDTDRTLLYYKYFGIMPEDKNFDLKSRNYFRKQNRAIEKFDNILKAKGYDEKWFLDKYLKISYIAGIYQKTINETGKKHVIDWLFFSKKFFFGFLFWWFKQIIHYRYWYYR